jgi:23S rRNA (adenine2503-C2)-methyltransferase
VEKQLTALNSLSFEELKAAIIKGGFAPFRSKQIFAWLHQRMVFDFEAMTDLSKGDRENLKKQFSLDLASIDKVQRSKDGTKKYLIRFADGKCVECVLMPNWSSDERSTLCISTQIGCALDCQFCATGRGGFKRNLTAGEIVQQVELIAKEILQEKSPAEKKTLNASSAEDNPISNIVVMGMGEPFLNYDNLITALKILLDGSGMNFSARKITVSTSGIPEKVIEFSKWDKQVRLAWSLNAPNDTIRSAIMPINEKYPIKPVLAAFQKYCHDTGRRITLEYVLLKGINDTKEMLDELFVLAKKVDCNLNLIVYNSSPGTPFQAPSDADVDQIFRYLQSKDLLVTIRKSRGQDISAACGQLAFESKGKKS